MELLHSCLHWPCTQCQWLPALLGLEARCLLQVIRPMYSNPPKHGSAIVTTILSDRELFSQWKVRCVLACPSLQCLLRLLTR